MYYMCGNKYNTDMKTIIRKHNLIIKINIEY